MRFSRISRLREWYNLPFGSIVIDEDVALTEDDQRDVVGRLKEVIRPFTLQRTADWVFRIMTEQKIIWLPMSPWQKVVRDERWAGIGSSVLGRCFGEDSLFICFRFVPSSSLSLRLIAKPQGVRRGAREGRRALGWDPRQVGPQQLVRRVDFGFSSERPAGGGSSLC